MNDGISSWSGAAPLAVILGSGLAGVCDLASAAKRVPYSELPGFGEPAVEGHPGFASLASFGGRPVLLFAGRTHLYEGGPPERLAAPLELARSLGCRRVLLTNAAGSLDPGVAPGSWLIPSDVISFPAKAARDFARPLPDRRSTARDPKEPLVSPPLREEVRAAARGASSPVVEGVLAWMSGPCYETAAEARAAATAGARAATMSVLPELVAARERGLGAAVLSRIVNFAPNVEGTPIDHAELLRTSGEACGELASILSVLLERIAAAK